MNRKKTIKKTTKKNIRKIITCVLCVAILSCNAMQTRAANRSDIDLNLLKMVFDSKYYYDSNADLQTAIGKDDAGLFAHFVTSGMEEGRSGNGTWDLRSYIQNNEDLMQVYGENYNAYLIHYLQTGKTEGRSGLKPIDSSKDIIGSYSSTYDVTQQRAINVNLATQRINGMVIAPGGSFSFNQAVLPRTFEYGYVVGPSYAGGREVVSVGGGICQVSSTLYVAMIRSTLPSTERHLHSAPVDYVPLGLDATIAGNSKDLKFTNIFSKPLMILATTENGVLTISLKLIG